jgi:hypothetical protein
MQRPFRLRKAYGATGCLGFATHLGTFHLSSSSLCAFAALREIFLFVH